MKVVLEVRNLGFYFDRLAFYYVHISRNVTVGAISFSPADPPIIIIMIERFLCIFVVALLKKLLENKRDRYQLHIGQGIW